MFGYITLNKPEMKVKNLEAYQACYCGLCHELQHRFGVKAQLLLSYDCTFQTQHLAAMSHRTSFTISPAYSGSSASSAASRL